MYNSKDLITDNNLTFLSYNQTVNCEFRLDEILESPLWKTNQENVLIKAVPLFNCDIITSSNSSDIILDDNKCIICQNVPDTLITCTSNDTGNIHYYTIELYAYAPYTKLDLVDEVHVYCIIYDEYMNTINNVEVNVYVDDTLTDTVTSDNKGVCKYTVDQESSIKFVYGTMESEEITIGG